MIAQEDLQEEFKKIFAASPEYVTRAPGRVNLIGEHTDYNEGLVLPMAIDRTISIAARRRNDRTVRMLALDFDSARSEFSLDDIQPNPICAWSNYVRCVARMLGPNLAGVDMLIHGNVPIGSGLSSSAALEVCAAVTFRKLNELKIGNLELARICQRAENEFVGVHSGIMDQFVSLFAREDHALLLDCRDMSYEQVALPRGGAIVVCDTKKRRSLVDSEYNTRRTECVNAVKLLGLRSLREAALTDLKRLSGVLERRARHVVTENERVKRAVVACQASDLAALGQLLNESHASLRDDYEVSCAELDAMVEVAQKQVGCYGARLTGAGFGGCTVNLVDAGVVPQFVGHVEAEYTAWARFSPEIYVCRASEGAG